MTALIVLVWILGCGVWAVSRFGGTLDSPTGSAQASGRTAARPPSPSGEQRIDISLAECDPVWGSLDDRQLERLLKDAAS